MAKKLTPRNPTSTPAKTRKRSSEPAAPQAAGPSSAEALHDAETVTMPDPDAADRKEHPEKYRKGLPSGMISHTCGKCKVMSTVYVDEPALYDQKARVELFRERGSCYDPPLCRWCFKRQPASKRKSA